MSKNIIKLSIFSLLPLLIILILLETGLRIAAFEYSDTPLKILSYPESVHNKLSGKQIDKNQVSIFVKDKYQHWVPKPSFEDSYSLIKDPGTLRIAMMGCSCTQGCAFTQESYPGHVEQILNENSDRKIEVLNAGVGSYSTHQGLMRLKHAVAPYHPDIVTIYFGWNDHWIGGKPDHEIEMKSDWQIRAINFLEKFKTFQAYHYLIDTILGRTREARKGNAPQGEDRLVLRVPPPRYKENLTEMIRFARENRMKPVLITAYGEYAELRPFSNFPFPVERLQEIHRVYNQIVRNVAQEEKVPLIDLETILTQISQNNDTDILADGIHFTPYGCRLAGEIIAKILAENVVR